MPTLDTNLKEDLIGCKNSFFVPYKKNITLIKNLDLVVANAQKNLKSYQDNLRKTLPGAPDTFPVYLTPQEMRQRKESAFSIIVRELHTYLNEVLLGGLISYENKVLRQLKKTVEGIGIITGNVLQQIRTKPVVLAFSRSELNALEDLLKIILNQIEDFEKDSNELLTKIALISQYQTIRTEYKTPLPQLTKSEFFEKYNKFLLESRVILSRLYNYIQNITKQIKILDKQTADLIKALYKVY